MGITNCLSNITGILAPLAVQYIVTDYVSTQKATNKLIEFFIFF